MDSVATSAVFTVWFFLLGGCIGSFLNVVVYRLPLGKSLSDPPSHCPKCSHRIRWYDNLPVLGWLRLRGQCRDCHEPISFRYPLIEAVVAIFFGLIAWCIFYFPSHSTEGTRFFLTVALSSVLTTVLGAGLMERDQVIIPWKLFLPAFALAVCIPPLWHAFFGSSLVVSIHVIRWLSPVWAFVAFLLAGLFYRRTQNCRAIQLSVLLLGLLLDWIVLPLFVFAWSIQFLLGRTRFLHSCTLLVLTFSAFAVIMILCSPLSFR